ncbi:mechanosensitive ion channel family protein [bacterium]|nr:mechanosensitive ion channel family protein [bacterium]MBU3955166.1 mechanosensitive ion channel family protein [bacterium]MBU4134100.1 mechanosensitive ion channel family protein [bacterium]
MNEILNKVFLMNTVKDYIISAGMLAAGIIVIKMARALIIKRLKALAEKTTAQWDDMAVALLNDKIFPLLYLGVFYISVRILNLSAALFSVVKIAGTAVFIVLLVQIIISAIALFIDMCWVSRDERVRKEGLGGIMTSIKLVVWLAAFLFFLDNMGIKISSVLAGLGIGGIAIALAAQAVLGDLFSYFSIFFDRPFGVGDFIIVGEYMGTVEYIGMKTTRIRSLGGEQVIFSNSDLTNSRVKNYKRMLQRRVVFKVGVTYQTPVEKLKIIPDIIKSAVEKAGNTVFDRSHFFSFGAFSLDFETVYYVASGDYNQYMDAQQKINLTLKKEFEERMIDFAYPTQLVYLNKSVS